MSDSERNDQPRLRSRRRVHTAGAFDHIQRVLVDEEQNMPPYRNVGHQQPGVRLSDACIIPNQRPDYKS